jgi:hypothetical protein
MTGSSKSLSFTISNQKYEIMFFLIRAKFPAIAIDLIESEIKTTLDIVNEDTWDRVVGIATGYELEVLGVGVRVPVGARFTFSPRRPDRFWYPH